MTSSRTLLYSIITTSLLFCSPTLWSANLVLNSEFDQNTSQWLEIYGTAGWSFTPSEGSPLPGSGALRLISPNDYAAVGQCIRNIQGINSFDAIARTKIGFFARPAVRTPDRPIDPGRPVNVSLEIHEGSNCDSNVLVTWFLANPIPQGDGWEEYSLTNIPMPISAQSALVKIELQNVLYTQGALIDHIEFGSTGTLQDRIFGDSFEP